MRYVSTVVMCLWAASALAQGRLENPTPNSIQSGQGIISGWLCQATTVELVVNGTIRAFAPYGTLRGDTQATCGDTNNGFGFQVNWNEFGDGTHILTVLVDGTQFTQVGFSVKTLGVPYLTGASGNYRLPGFAGKDVTIAWSEALQNFVITGWSAVSDPPPPDPNADLRALLGGWQFSYVIISTFQDTYRLNSIELASGKNVIVGTDSNGGTVIVLRVVDAGVTGFPYTFFLLDPGVIICKGFAFNQTGPNNVQGVYAHFAATPSGGCGNLTSNLYNMTGVRVSGSLSSSPTSVSPLSLEYQARQEDTLQPSTHAPTADFSALADRAEALLR